MQLGCQHFFSSGKRFPWNLNLMPKPKTGFQEMGALLKMMNALGLENFLSDLEPFNN